MLTDRQKFHLVLIALVGLVAVLIGFLRGWSYSDHAHVKLRLSYKLTQARAIDLSPAQINGTVPLMVLDGAAGDGAYYAPPTLGDLLYSMQHDARQSGLDGVCAMNYNQPVSVCYMPQLGRERDVVMYNLRMIGFSAGKYMGDEYSLLCDEGRTAHGVERFRSVWIEYNDASGERNMLYIGGRMGRVVQHMAWLNRGVTVCDEMSLQKQADIMYELTLFESAANPRAGRG